MQKHSRAVEGGRAFWLTERLWELSKDLPVESIRLDDIREIDEDCWFGPGVEPTCRKIAEHARLIQDADLSHPIILSVDGKLMDGGHRLCKALLLDMKEISAVRFEVDPEPDYILPASDNL